LGPTQPSIQRVRGALSPVVKPHGREAYHSPTASADFKKIYYVYLLLTAIGLMPGGSVYKDHTFNKETAHLTYTAQYKYMNIYSTIQYIYINTKQMNITQHKKQKIQKKNTENTK
jgi:hypothetical protein